MFDSHCHLNFDVFQNIIKGTIELSRSKGVDYFMIPGVDIESSKKALKVAEDYHGAYCAVGIHPTVRLNIDRLKLTLNKINELIDKSFKVKAIGEIGLDYYKYTSGKSVQQTYLKEQIKIAVKRDISIIIHNRHAEEDLINILNKVWQKTMRYKVVLHCCEPSKKLLKFAVQNRVYMGFDGDVTYDRNKQEYIKKVPLELLVLETDSPFLTPKPAKKEKSFPNTPSNLPYVLEAIANIRGDSKKDLARITTNNAKRLFNLN